MKKLFRIPIVIILLVGVGFMYLIKNPELPISQKILMSIGITIGRTNDGKQAAIDPTCTNYFDGCNTCMVSGGIIGGCTRMYCETPSEPKCLAYASTGIDLTNCIRYFDGCNNCSSGGPGQPMACTMMYCETPTEPKCLEYASGNNGGSVGLANPASTNCINNGGTLEMLEGTGGQYGMCHLPDGTSCEERSYMRGECGSKQDNVQAESGVSPGNPGSAPGSESPTACTMEYAPVCASVQVQCIKAPCPPIEQTFGNTCTMNANKLATFLHDGECAK